jgi:hypothetical protein
MSGLFDLVLIALKAMGHRAEIARVWELIQPAVEHLQKVLPDLGPLVKNLMAALIPEMQRQFAEGGTIVLTFDVAWLQRSLNKLGIAKLKVDGVYGRATYEAVRQFQIVHKLMPDGWAGRDTIMAIAVELARHA